MKKTFSFILIFTTILFLVFSPLFDVMTEKRPEQAHAFVSTIDIVQLPLQAVWFAMQMIALETGNNATQTSKSVTKSLEKGTPPDINLSWGSILGTVKQFAAGVGLTMASGTLNFSTFIKSVIKRLISEIMRDAAAWASSGFGGKPNFVKNWKNLLRTQVLNASAEFVQSLPSLTQFCAPIDIKLQKFIVNRTHPAFKSPFGKYTTRDWTPDNRCNLETIMTNIKSADVSYSAANYKNEVVSIQQSGGIGGPVMAMIIMEPQNNPLGLMYMAENEARTKQKEAEKTKENEVIAGQGFLNSVRWQECETFSDWGVETENCTTHTPGSYIKDTISNINLGPLNDVIDMNELADLFTAIVNSQLDSLVSSLADPLKDFMQGVGLSGYQMDLGKYGN